MTDPTNGGRRIPAWMYLAGCLLAPFHSRAALAAERERSLGLVTLLESTPEEGGLRFLHEGPRVTTAGFSRIGCPELACAVGDGLDASEAEGLLRYVAARLGGKPPRRPRTSSTGDLLIRVVPEADGPVEVTWWHCGVGPPPWRR